MAESYELYHLGIRSGDVPQCVVLVEPELSELTWGGQWRRTELARRREFNTFLLESGPLRLLICLGGCGSPATVIAAEELMRAGASHILGVSMCRCSDCAGPNLIQGLGVVIGAEREERTSRDYAPAEFPACPDPMLMLRLLELPTAKPVMVRTVDVLDEWRTSPLEARPGHVDLSSSALLVAGAAAGVSAAALVVPAGAAQSADIGGALTALAQHQLRPDRGSPA